jgi:hypothetical protein
MKWIGRSSLWSGLRLPFCSSEICNEKRPNAAVANAFGLKRAYKILSSFFARMAVATR